MSRYGQTQQPAPAYPLPPPSTFPQAFVAPPPMGYPTKDGPQYRENNPPVETTSKGDGFWKGCCAALCCCCLLDACF
ncbi:hypothetical protein SLE2022_205290 [Rubroshorea leprosula]